jgi:anaerobic selenocysteine-containing dehydrogenase
MHAEDAVKRGLAAGDRVRVVSRVGHVEAPLELRADLMPGVVSVPHGWGHDAPGLLLHLATQRPGVNCNALTDDAELEPIVGNAIFSGVPVRVEAVRDEDAVVGEAASDDDAVLGEARTPTRSPS